MGSLQAEPGATPVFAQIYVLDPALETTTRFANMTLPASTTQQERESMKNLLETVQQEIHENNPFVREFNQILDQPEEDLEGGTVVISAAARPHQGHARVYNAQTNLQELSIVTNEKPHDLVVRLRGGGLQFISDLNPKAMPLHFTLLFVLGTPGWDQFLKHADGVKRVSPREFYVYHLNIRHTGSDYIFQARRLFQEWILNAWITCENQRLNFQRQNQKTLRADTYRNLQEAVAERRQQAPADSLYNNERENAVGRVILASSFQCSHRWYLEKFQDGMAICRYFHKPDVFVTMTCNPKWPEITAGLSPGQSPQDRPDLVSRVFKLKKDQLMRDLTKGCIFGKTLAHLWVVEFQKRGLPHVHILIILADEDRPKTREQIDQIVSAELPPNPSEPGISEEEKSRRQPLWDVVLNNMIHGPCGAQNPRCPCMENGVCTKKFPKPFRQQTLVDEATSHPTYQRRSPQHGGVTVEKDGKTINNGWVVPYNAFLLLRYGCHINVEICISAMAAKYLYKYVTKGPDRAMVSAEVRI